MKRQADATPIFTVSELFCDIRSSHRVLGILSESERLRKNAVDSSCAAHVGRKILFRRQRCGRVYLRASEDLYSKHSIVCLSSFQSRALIIGDLFPAVPRRPNERRIVSPFEV